MAYFIWNGVNSQTKGIEVLDYPPVVKPQERITQVTVPGRQGDLMIPEKNDEPMFEPYLKTVTCCLMPGAGIHDAVAWLRGSGTVTFGNEPGMIYEARIINQISFEKIMRGHEHRKFAVPFFCQPLKAMAEASLPVTLNSSGSQIVNPGDVVSHPQWIVYGSGVCKFSVEGCSDECQIDIGNDGYLIVDSELMICTNGSGKNRCSRMRAEYPLLNIGTNTVNWEGSITKIVVQGRWRWL